MVHWLDMHRSENGVHLTACGKPAPRVAGGTDPQSTRTPQSVTCGSCLRVLRARER